MKVTKILLTLILSTFISCSIIFGKSIPKTTNLNNIDKSNVFDNDPQTFRIFAKGYIKVDENIDRLRMLLLCDLKNERFRLEIIPQNSSLPLGIITALDNEFKYFNPLKKQIISDNKIENLTEKLIGIKASHIDLCSIFSGKLIKKYYPNLKKVTNNSLEFIDLDKKNEYIFSSELRIREVNFGKYTNLYKVFNIKINDDRESLFINSEKINLKSKFIYTKKIVENFKKSLFIL